VTIFGVEIGSHVNTIAYAPLDKFSFASVLKGNELLASFRKIDNSRASAFAPGLLVPWLFAVGAIFCILFQGRVIARVHFVEQRE